MLLRIKLLQSIDFIKNQQDWYRNLLAGVMLQLAQNLKVYSYNITTPRKDL